MTRVRGSFLFVFALLAPLVARAATTDFRVLIDVDHNAATGCSVSGLPGVDTVFITTVVTDATTARVTRTATQSCSGGTLSAPADVDTTGWPAGFNAESGHLQVETRMPFSALGGSGISPNMHLAIEAVQGAAVHTALTRPNGSEVLFPVPIGRRRSVSAPGTARVFVLDGLVDDWQHIQPIFTGLGASGSPALRMLNFFVFADTTANILYFRFDANLSTDAPFASDDTFSRGAGESLSVAAPGVLANDGDPAGLPLTAAPVSEPSRGSVTLNADGSFTYTPDDPASTAADIFEYQASNGTKNSNTARVSITVATTPGPSNGEPNANDDSYATTEDVALNVPAPGVLANDTDSDGPSLTATLLSSPSHGSVTLASGGGFTYTPAANYFGTDTFTYTLTDGTDSDTATVTITIASENDFPNVKSATFSIPENSPNGTAVGTAHVTDVDAGDSHTWSITGGNTGGAFAINPATGAIRVANTSAVDFEVNPQFTLTVRAADNGTPSRSDTGTITIDVTDLNEAPVATAQSVTTPEDTPLSITLGGTDDDGDALTFNYTQPAHGTVTGAGPGVTYTPDADYFGPDSFTYTVSDGAFSSPATTIAITVTSVNDVPVATADSYTVAEGGTLSDNVLTNDTDVEGPLNAVLVSTTTNGSLTLNPNGTFTYVHNGSETTSDSFTYHANDGAASSSDVTVSITVTPVNDAPVAVADGYSVNEGGTLNGTTVLANDTDVEGNPLTASLVTGPASALSFTLNADGTFTYVHDSSETLTDSFTYRANDGSLDSNTVTVSITINPVNDAPVAVADGGYNVNEGGSLAGTSVLANDTDPENDALTAVLVSGPVNASSFTLNPDGTFNYLHDGTETTSDSFTYKANDGALDSNTVTVTITVTPVNDAPVAVADGGYSVAEGGTISGAATVLANDTDVEGNTLNAVLVTGPSNAASFTLNADGTFNYTHNGSETASDSFTYRANDGSLDSNTVTVTIAVTPVNDAPVAVADSGYTVAEGGNVTGAPSVLTNDVDAEGNTLTAVLVSGPANASSFTLNANGTFDYTHNGSETTSDSFTYKANDGLLDSNTVTVSITVTPGNDPPTATADAYSVNEGGTLNELAGTGVLANDTDPDSTVTAVLVSGPTNASAFSLNADGSFTYTHNGSETTIDSFTYKANDGTVDSSTVAVTITVTPVNDAPVAVADSGYTILEGGSVTGASSVLSNDTDAEGNALTAALVTGPSNASSFTLNSDGTFDYAHNGSETAGDSFTYKANDGGADSNIVTVSIVITPVNDAPVAVADSGYTFAEGSVNTNAPTVLGNDTDPENDTLTAILVSGPTNEASFTLNANGTFDYTHDGSETTSDSFTYKANDGAADSNTVTVSITITPVNDAPVAVADSGTVVGEGGTVTGAPTVLANDTDAEGNTLTAVLVSGPANDAAFTLHPDGTFDYTHDGSETTADSFTYKANDGTADSNVVTVTIAITPANDAPVAVADSGYTVAEGGSVSGAATVLGNDTDAENNALTAVLVAGPSNDASFTLYADGTFDYSHDGSETTTDSFTYKANDGSLDSNTVTVNITITATNDTPVATGDAYTVNEGGTLTETAATGVLANDTDPDSTLTAVLVSGPSNHSAFTLNADGSFTYTHNGGETTTDSFTYKANDGTVDSGTVTVNITVTPVNDTPVAVADSGYTVGEGGNVTGAATVLSNDTDAEGNTLNAVLVSGPSNEASFTLNADGTFDYTHDGSETTSDSFTYKANDGTADSNTVTVAIAITPVNDAPVAVADSGYTAGEGASVTGASTVLGNDTDAENDTLTAIMVSGPANSSSFTLHADGTFDYTHNGGETTSDSFTYKANDGFLDSNTVTVSITITPANDAPVAVADSGYTFDEGSVNTGAVTVLGNDTDAENDTLTAALVSGPSNASSFTLNSDGTFDYTHNGSETTADSFTYKANDGSADSNTVSVSIVINPINEAPVFTSGATPSVAENTTAVTTVAATDPEGTVLSYSLSGGADQLLFAINSSTGALTFLSAPDFDIPGDSDANNQYLVDVTTTDGVNPVTQSLTVTVTNENEAPSFTSANANSVPENTVAAHTVTTSDPDGDSINYTVTGGADAGDFSIGLTTGLLTFNVAPDFENPADADANNQYVVDVTATDGANPITQTITITVTAVNEPPAFTSSNTASVSENTTAVHTVTTTDPEGNTVTYTVTGGADQSKFTIDLNTGALSFLAAPDFETPLDADANNVYLVEVTANDGTNNAVQSISVSVVDGNEAPVFTSSATPSVLENQTAVITVTTTDAENDPRTYTISGGVDSGLFSIDLNSGALTFNTPPDFEAPADSGANNVYDVQVQANDGNFSVTQNLTITVTNVNEAPVYSSGASFTQAENISAVTTVTASDPEGVAIVYSISGGADAGDFSIVAATGALSFATPPDFDIPADADSNNVYEVEVTATDGVNPVPQSITVTITAVDETPVFTSSATPSVPENGTAVTTVQAVDPEGVVLTYSISGGADATDFTINPTTGDLTFNVAPDFELPGDADANNIYVVDVQTTDSTTGLVTQTINVTVTNVNEAPSITSANTANVPENTTTVIDVNATDPDAAAVLTYSISGGADSALFSIVSTTGVVTFNSAPNFEVPGDAGANNVYDIEVTVTDGTNPVTQTIAVTVTNVDEAPVFSSANSASVDENVTAVIDVDAADPEGVALTYSIVGGADQGDFSIVPATGVLTFSPAPNFEAPADADTNNIYIVQVQATDGTQPSTQTITVTVTNVNEAPVNTVPGAQSTNEDTNKVFSSGNANQISVSDPDGNVNVQVTLTSTNGTLSTNGVVGLTFTPPGASNDGVDDTTLVFTGTVNAINTALNGLTYKPALNYYGAAAVTILTNDQGNTGSGGAQQSNGGTPNSIAITVVPVNDKPTTASYTVANGNAHITHSGLGITISAADSNELKEDAADVDDHDPYSELTVQIVGGSLSPANATLTLIDASTGAFYFEPPGGLSGSGVASFQYQVCDNGDVGLSLAPQCSDPATVQFTITGTDTWYVDDTDAAGCGVTCNGSRTKPLVGLNSATLVTRGTGDRIFAFSGTYNHGFTMAANEALIGQASSGSFDTLLGVVVPSNGTLDTRPSVSGAAVTLQNTLTAVGGTLLRGVSISSGVNKGYVASGNSLTVLQTSVTTSNKAVEIANSTTSSVTLTSTTSTGGTHGINLSNVSGTFDLGSGALTNNTTAGFALTQNAANTAAITFGGNINPTAAGRAIDIGSGVASSGMRGGTIALSGNIGNTSANNSGIRVRNSTAGTLNLTGSTYAMTTGATHAVELTTNPGATFNFNPGTSIAINTTTGRGFLGSGGGTINVTGDNNTINTTSGGAFEVFGTNAVHMGGGYRWKSITSTNGTDGISLQFHDGAFTVTGDGPDGDTLPDSVTAGGTITGSDQRGAEFIDVDGPVSLNGMTFTNPADTIGPDATVATGTCGSAASGGSNTGCFAGIHYDTVSNVSLNTIAVTGSGQMGINGNAVTNLTMNTVTINNAGTSAQEDALRMYNLSGSSGGITGLSIDNPFAMGINLENTNATLASEGSPFLITNATITDSIAAQGAVFHTVSSGNAFVKFVNGTISGHFSVGIQTSSDVGATGQLGVYVDGTSFSNVAGAIHLQAGGGTHKFDIRNINMVARASGASHSIMLKADSAGFLTGKVYSNTIGSTTAYSGAPSGSYAISADARNTSTITAEIRGNTLRHADAGIDVGGGQGSSRVNLTVTGNRILDPEATGLAGIYANSGVLSGDSSCITMQIGGLTAYPGSPTATESEIQNQVEGNWPSGSIRVIKSFGGSPPDPVFNLPGYPGSGVVAWITARNSFVGAGTPVTQNPGAGGAFTGAVSCP